MPFVTGSLIGAGAGILGSLLQSGAGVGLGLYGASQQADVADANRREAARQFDENMAWQREVLNRYEKMSNTAHQREVEDLIAAGLNPILSATGGSGASSAMGPGGVSPTAHAGELDVSGSLGVMQRALSDANDQALKSMDFYSQAGLREAQSAEALSNAAKNKELTPAMRSELEERANSASASANYHNTLASQAGWLTPLQMQLMREKIANEQATGAGLRINNKWIDRKNQMHLIQAGAKAAWMRNNITMQKINSAKGVFDSVVNALRPKVFNISNFQRGDDYAGDVVFNR